MSIDLEVLRRLCYIIVSDSVSDVNTPIPDERHLTEKWSELRNSLPTMSAKEFKAVFPTSEWGRDFKEASLVIPHDALQFSWPPEAQSGDHESVTDVPSPNAGENLTASEENLTASDEAPGRASSFVLG